MKKVAAQYDPSGVFQTLVPGGFKLSQRAAAAHDSNYFYMALAVASFLS